MSGPISACSPHPDSRWTRSFVPVLAACTQRLIEGAGGCSALSLSDAQAHLSVQQRFCNSTTFQLAAEELRALP